MKKSSKHPFNEYSIGIVILQFIHPSSKYSFSRVNNSFKNNLLYCYPPTTEQFFQSLEKYNTTSIVYLLKGIIEKKFTSLNAGKCYFDCLQFAIKTNHKDYLPILISNSG